MKRAAFLLTVGVCVWGCVETCTITWATTLPEVTKIETYMYLGKSHPQVWFEQMYKEFADKIVFADGKYLDAGKSALSGWPEIDPTSPATSVWGKTPYGCKVRQVLSPNDVLIERPSEVREWPDPLGVQFYTVPALLFHVKGVDTKGLVDGTEFKARLVYTGTYSYSGRTIASYTIYGPLSKEQFADALAKGFKLVRYKKVSHKEPDKKLPGTPNVGPPGRFPPRVQKGETTTSIVGTPVQG